MNALPRSFVGTGLGTFVLAGAVFVLADPSTASASIEVMTCQPSSQRARITIDLNGRLARDVKVVVTTLGYRHIKSLAVGQAGLVVLPRLSPAQYLVTASAQRNQSGSICLEMSDQKGSEISSFPLTLHPVPPPSPTLEQALRGAGKTAPSENIQQFNGVVVDPSGATISGTAIQIFPKGVRVSDDKRSIKVLSGSMGEFSVELTDGVYTALFMSPGIKQKIVTFEISRRGAASGLRITLQLGEVT
jgi:hypothetical protein